LFQAAVNRCLPISLVAEAIDYGAQKKRIADELRKFTPPQGLDTSAFAHDYFNGNPAAI